MKQHKILVDPKKHLNEQPGVGHNRWHPDIPPVMHADPGDIVEMECLDGFDGYFDKGSTHKDVSSLILERIHPLSGPVYINGAEPGDILEVDILEIECGEFGTSPIIPGSNFLPDQFIEPYLSRWEMNSRVAVSKDIPGVHIPANPMIGVLGVAPSKELMQRIVERERDVVKSGGAAMLPDAFQAVPAEAGIANEGIRTIAPHECGGNMDIKEMAKNTTVFFPVFVKGGLFSAGDVHFAQGDGEVCGTAIETTAKLKVRFGLRKKAATKNSLKSVEYFLPPNAPSAASDILGRKGYYVTTGLPITAVGKNDAGNIALSARNAVLNMLDYITRARPYNRAQALVICSLAADLRISQCVDVPNFTVSVHLPLAVFTE